MSKISEDDFYNIQHDDVLNERLEQLGIDAKAFYEVLSHSVDISKMENTTEKHADGDSMRLINADLLEEVLSNALSVGDKHFETNEKKGTDFAIEIATRMILELVKKQPTIKNDGWHVVADGDLPEESGHYLVTYHAWSDGNYLPKFDDTFVKRMHYQISGKFIGWNYPVCINEEAEADEHREVVAWQPLPKKYIPKENKERSETHE